MNKSIEQLNHHLECRLVNGIQGDPGLYIRSLRSGDAILVDCGSCDALSPKEILRIRLLLITHTHVDHFIGFDRILRINIPHFRTIEVMGPPGIAKNVQSKILGYHWNLLDKGQLNYVVHEYDVACGFKSYLISNDHNFELHQSPELTTAFVDKYRFCFDEHLLVDGFALDHGTPSMGYRIQVPGRWQVDAQKLDALGIEPGPWVGQVQKDLVKGQSVNLNLIPGDHILAQQALDHGFIQIPPASLAYVSDFGFLRENLAALKKHWGRLDRLYSESSFSDQDVARAHRTKHLSSRQAALIAAHLGVTELELFHISGIYGEQYMGVVDEALGFWEVFRSLSDKELEVEISAELECMKQLEQAKKQPAVIDEHF